MITASPKGDIAGGSDCCLNTYTALEEVSSDTARCNGGHRLLGIQKSGNTDRSESRESKKIRNRRSKRVKRQKVTI